MKTLKAKVVRADWLGTCERCGGGEIVAMTYIGNETLLYEDDSIKCLNCGLRGVVDVTDDYSDDCVAFAVWNQDYKSGLEDRFNMKDLINKIHEQNVKAGWWTDLATGESLTSKNGEPAKRNVPEMLCLIHSEISEAMEGHRKNLMDDKLPHRSMLEVELADAVIRICDMAGGLGLDLDGAIHEKLEYNKQRADHKIENRLLANGKKF
ncbi:nucleoside triphosphate pyrophosphohydrolase family protein [Acinetobacter baumannii]|uniref:hypothetical protein n=2 Tax=Acinetobacter baumannii TaxID=470 RepID=UPI001F2137A2|nr:hypothetical protein [Acinetobacter baumannii]